MEIIKEEVAIQASLQAFNNFGISNQPSTSGNVNKMTNGQNLPNQNVNSNSHNNSPYQGKGQGKGKGISNQNVNSNKDKPTFVRFSTLTGVDKIKAMKSRGYCPNCAKKQHQNGEKCEAKDHKCMKCDKSHHFDHCCAFPKDPKLKQD